jgi:hypothetical protein
MFTQYRALAQGLRSVSVLSFTLAGLLAMAASVADAQEQPRKRGPRPPVSVEAPADLTFTAMEGQSNPPAQTLTITNTGTEEMYLIARSNARWLRVRPNSGNIGPNQSKVVTVRVHTLSLPAGTYEGILTVGSPGSRTVPRKIQVALHVVAPAPTVGLSPESLAFTGAEGGSNPTAQTLRITNPGKGTLNWSISDNATWLSVSQTSGTTTTETDTITVNVNTNGLAANMYKGTITITDPNAMNNPQQIPVTLALTAPQSSLAVLSWDPNTEGDLAGYKVYLGMASRSYGSPVDVGSATSFKMTNLKHGQTYYFAVTAYDTEGNESEYSAEVSKTAAPE